MNENHFKTRTKLVLGILVILSLLLGMTLAVSAGSESEIIASGSCGNNASWTLDNDGTLTISGTGKTGKLSNLKKKALIKKVVVTPGVAGLADKMFSDCESMKEVVLPDDFKEFGNYTFLNCSSLTTISIPEGVSALPVGVFGGCLSLEEIHIPDTVTSIGGKAFYGCDALKEIDIPDAVNEIGMYAFAFSGLTNIVIPEGVEVLPEETFYCANQLKEITLPNTLTSIEKDAFTGCDNLEEITIPVNVKSIGSSFYPVNGTITFRGNCPALASDCLSGFEGTIYYPRGNDTWNDSTMLDYEGNPTWVAADLPALPSLSKVASSGGFGAAKNAGDTDLLRIYGNNRKETSYAIADQMKAILDVKKFDKIILVSSQNYADAVSASSLAAKEKAPILLADLTDKNYLRNNIAKGGTLYLIGGKDVYSTNYLSSLNEIAKKQGFTVEQIAGKDRYETNKKILDKVGAPLEEIIICTGENVADAVSASATGKPILLVNTKNQKNVESAMAYLKEHVGLNAKVTILGGKNTISDKFVNDLIFVGYTEVNRLAGKDRYETSIMAAKEFFDVSNLHKVSLAWGQNPVDAICGAPLAHLWGSPILLVDETVNPKAYGFLPKDVCVVGFGGPGSFFNRQLTNKAMNCIRAGEITEYKY